MCRHPNARTGDLLVLHVAMDVQSMYNMEDDHLTPPDARLTTQRKSALP
jgi:hypothetical protein